MLKKRVDVMSTVVETSRLPLQSSIAYGDFANTRCKKSSKLGFNSFNCKIDNTRLSQPTRQHLELLPCPRGHCERAMFATAGGLPPQRSAVRLYHEVAEGRECYA